MHEAEIETTVCYHVTDLGGIAIKLAATTRGFPDRTILLPGNRICFIEFKKPGGRLSFHQQTWISTLQTLGFVVRVFSGKEEAIAFLDAFSKRI